MRFIAKEGPILRRGLGPGAFAAAIVLAAAAFYLSAQSAGARRFAVASVKRNPSTEPLSMEVPMGVGMRPGGRLVAGNAPLTMLIQRAYAVQPFQVVGGPAWTATDGYDIEAKPAANSDQKTMWLMLQALLADRFQLKLHRETRELPVYDLTVAKGGARLPPPEEGGCAEVMTMPLPDPGQPRPAPPCGPGVVRSGTGLTMLGSSVPMAAFTRQLSTMLGREVIDKTGFARRFSFRLDFAIDDALAGLPNPQGPRATAEPADLAARPSILAALPEQLGLKLERSKGPVEVLVIDQVERPAAN